MSVHFAVTLQLPLQGNLSNTANPLRVATVFGAPLQATTVHPPALPSSTRFPNAGSLTSASNNFLTLLTSHGPPLTLSFWVLATFAYTMSTPIGLKSDSSTSAALQVQIAASGAVMVKLGYTGGSWSSTLTTPTATLTANVWSFLTLTITWDRVVTLYKYGLPITSTRLSVLPQGFNILYVGSSADGTVGFDGYIADVKMYSAALADAPVEAAFTATAFLTSPRCPTVAKWMYYYDDGTEGKDSCILLDTRLKTWQQAYSSCPIGSHLVTISGSNKLTGLASMLAVIAASTVQGTDGVFVGCSQSASALTPTSGWSWVDTTPTTNINCGAGCNLWIPGEPNESYATTPGTEGHTEDCCDLKASGFLNDDRCSDTFTFLCEFDIPTRECALWPGVAEFCVQYRFLVCMMCVFQPPQVQLVPRHLRSLFQQAAPSPFLAH